MTKLPTDREQLRSLRHAIAKLASGYEKTLEATDVRTDEAKRGYCAALQSAVNDLRMLSADAMLQARQDCERDVIAEEILDLQWDWFGTAEDVDPEKLIDFDRLTELADRIRAGHYAKGTTDGKSE